MESALDGSVANENPRARRGARRTRRPSRLALGAAPSEPRRLRLVPRVGSSTRGPFAKLKSSAAALFCPCPSTADIEAVHSVRRARHDGAMNDATVNGVSAPDARALYAIADEACAALSGHPREAVFAALRGLELAIGTDWSPAGATMKYLSPKELFADAKSFADALAARTREARVAAFPVLVELDAEAAAPLFARSLPLRLENSHQVSFEGNIYRALWARWQPLGARLPAATFGALFLEGRFELHALTDAQVAAIPGRALLEALVQNRVPYPSSGDPERLLRLHPALESLDARGALAERLAASGGHFTRRLFPLLMADLVAARHPSALPAACAHLERMGPGVPYALGLVIALGHEPTLRRLHDELPRLAARSELAWDSHHADRELAPAIRAGYALESGDVEPALRPPLRAGAPRRQPRLQGRVGYLDDWRRQAREPRRHEPPHRRRAGGRRRFAAGPPSRRVSSTTRASRPRRGGCAS